MNKFALTDFQKQIIIGCTLGDLHIEQSPNGRTARLVFEHSIKQWFNEIKTIERRYFKYT